MDWALGSLGIVLHSSSILHTPEQRGLEEGMASTSSLHPPTKRPTNHLCAEKGQLQLRDELYQHIVSALEDCAREGVGGSLLKSIDTDIWGLYKHAELVLFLNICRRMDGKLSVSGNKSSLIKRLNHFIDRNVRSTNAYATRECFFDEVSNKKKKKRKRHRSSDSSVEEGSAVQGKDQIGIDVLESLRLSLLPSVKTLSNTDAKESISSQHKTVSQPTPVLIPQMFDRISSMKPDSIEQSRLFNELVSAEVPRDKAIEGIDACGGVQVASFEDVLEWIFSKIEEEVVIFVCTEQRYRS